MFQINGDLYVYFRYCQVARVEPDFYICVFQTLHPALEPSEDRKTEIQSQSPVSCAKGLPHIVEWDIVVVSFELKHLILCTVTIGNF